MKKHTARVLYYTSVATALVAILVSAVIINRTLVNAPSFNIEEISESAGAAASVYMAYVDEAEDVVIGTSDEEEDVANMLAFVNGISFGEPLTDEESITSPLDAWIIFYDKDNKIASRMNLYSGGDIIWYDGKRYAGNAEIADMLKNYCDEYNAVEKEEKTADNISEEADD